MLRENEDVISFFPGSVEKGQVTLGRIVVHDRLNVEAEVLPRYFNHSSFASLRRQLNYFSFTRLGKGRQRGATYCNEAVIQIDDILRLKRRSNTAPTRDTTAAAASTPTCTTFLHNFKRSRSVSVSSLEDTTQACPTKKSRPLVIVTPEFPKTLHRMVSDGEDSQHRISLDLTVPPIRDADILAGCQALLSIAKGLNDY
jgi:hypothetical protein